MGKLMGKLTGKLTGGQGGARSRSADVYDVGCGGEGEHANGDLGLGAVNNHWKLTIVSLTIVCTNNRSISRWLTIVSTNHR